MSPKQFDIPTKVHFLSASGSDVGSVFVDQVVPHDGGARFYFGRSCVATLSDTCLVIGPKQIERSVLSEEKPFWFSADEEEKSH